jgi:ankyrin repeat protein
MFVEAGSHINAVNVYRESPLHWACKEGTADIVRYLLLQQASPNAIDSDDNTPMHWAADYDQEEIVQLLIESGGGPSRYLKNDKGFTPLQVARRSNSRRVIRLLQRRGLFGFGNSV